MIANRKTSSVKSNKLKIDSVSLMHRILANKKIEAQKSFRAITIVQGIEIHKSLYLYIIIYKYILYD
jgi:hypothetical protein